VNAPRSSPQPVRAVVHGAGRTNRVIERSAGGVVTRVLGREPHVLLIRDPYRKWGLPKGHLEAGENDEEAALREVREETGLDDLSLGSDLGEIDWVFRRSGHSVHKFCRFFLIRSQEGEARPELAEGITECRWLPIREAMAAVAYDNAREVIRRAAEVIEQPDTTDPGSPQR